MKDEKVLRQEMEEDFLKFDTDIRNLISDNNLEGSDVDCILTELYNLSDYYVNMPVYYLVKNDSNYFIFNTNCMVKLIDDVYAHNTYFEDNEYLYRQYSHLPENAESLYEDFIDEEPQNVGKIISKSSKLEDFLDLGYSIKKFNDECFKAEKNR